MLESITAKLNSVKLSLSNAVVSAQNYVSSISLPSVAALTTGTAASTAAAATAVIGTSATAYYTAGALFPAPPPPPTFLELALSSVKAYTIDLLPEAALKTAGQGIGGLLVAYVALKGLKMISDSDSRVKKPEDKEEDLELGEGKVEDGKDNVKGTGDSGGSFLVKKKEEFDPPPVEDTLLTQGDGNAAAVKKDKGSVTFFL
jgi:hypothetical protein